MEAVLEIVRYTSNDRHLFENYQLKTGQEDLTAMPLDAIEQCRRDHNRYPFIILAEMQPAGFFVLQKGNGVLEYHKNSKAILLRAYSIAASFQGRGVAGKMLEQLPLVVKGNFPFSDEIILAVNKENVAAQHVYKKAGFIDKGLRAVGKIGEQLILHKMI
ncbi:GNAT family N-acetyltransferase [Niallia taxi]|uniref:GNAT family N-acetyltransferase n=2 Tax=Niallia taxi TaxID=2499688 RepID=UPI0023AA00CA|nr:GNAT family N-acetyltransferase [Niallia taxi]MDE5055479.1 GNAT family N-acetyltransferase [Niallia taxi]